jgi:hypothetical protein
MLRHRFWSAVAGQAIFFVVACGGGESSTLSLSPKAPDGFRSDSDARQPEADVPLEQKSDAPIDENAVERNFIPDLSLSATEGFIEVTRETFLKSSTAQSSALPSPNKCILRAGVSIRFVALGRSENGHRWVQLARSPDGCSLRQGYFFEEHVRMLNRTVFVAQAKIATRFKLRMADSSGLSSSEWCPLTPGHRYVLQGAPTDAGGGHAKVKFLAGEVSGCRFSEGFLFTEHFQDLVPSKAAETSDFARVMKHILLWEGGCSDHPQDDGGRTFKGITTAVARQEGWTRDVCTMPDSLVFSIYREGYWNPRAARYSWPLNLAVMNTEVNSGGGIAQRFIDRMRARAPLGSVVNQALWFVDQQIDYYRRIVASRPKDRVFLQGWLNRSNYMKQVMSGNQSLSLLSPGETAFQSDFQSAFQFEMYGGADGAVPFEATPKAYEIRP